MLFKPNDRGIPIFLNTFATPILDLITMLSYFLFLPFFIKRFHSQDLWNPLLVLGGYLLLCWGIFVCRKLELATTSPASSIEASKRRTTSDSRHGWIRILAWPYTVFVFVMFLESSGALVHGSSLGDKIQNLRGFQTIIMVFIFLLILLLFPLLLMVKKQPSIKFGTRPYLIYRFLGVSSVNLMAIITAAYWEYQLSDTQPMDIAVTGKILVFLISYIVFLMFYAPPRMALLDLEPSKWSFTGYLFILGYTIWGFIF